MGFSNVLWGILIQHVCWTLSSGKLRLLHIRVWRHHEETPNSLKAFQTGNNANLQDLQHFFNKRFELIRSGREPTTGILCTQSSWRTKPGTEYLDPSTFSTMAVNFPPLCKPFTWGSSVLHSESLSSLLDHISSLFPARAYLHNSAARWTAAWQRFEKNIISTLDTSVRAEMLHHLALYAVCQSGTPSRLRHVCVSGVNQYTSTADRLLRRDRNNNYSRERWMPVLAAWRCGDQNPQVWWPRRAELMRIQPSN